MPNPRASGASSDEPPEAEPPPARARTTTRTVLILHNHGVDDDDGGISRMKEAEDEVLEVAMHVERVLAVAGHRVERFAVGDTLDALDARLARGDVDVAFNLVESVGGDAGREPEIPQLLVARRVPFTGNSAPALRRALAKDRVRAALVEHGVAVSPALVVTRARRLPAPDDVGLAYPLFVKPARVDGSIGIDQGSVVGSYAALKARCELLLKRFGGAVLVEQYLPGPELNVAVCPDARRGLFAPTLLDFSGFAASQWPVVTYEAKWVEGTADYNCRSVALIDQLPREVVDETIATARAALDAIGADGYARVDMRLDAQRRPVVIDVNPNPALHPEAGFALALASIGIDYAQVVEGILDHALTREVRRAPARAPARRSRAARGAPVAG